MAAVIRMKRRVDEEPLNAFVLNCKRPKTDEPITEEVLQTNQTETSTILKFAGTISQAEHITTHLTKLTKDEARDLVTKVHRSDATTRKRIEARQNAHNERFKIVNCTRSLDEIDENKNYTIVDVEKETVDTVTLPTNANVVIKKTESGQGDDKDYVYDLYVTDDNATHIPCPDNIEDLRVEAMEYPLYFDHRGLNNGSDVEDSEDSNDENNWRNDYPDEDDNAFGGEDDLSIDEDDMKRAVEQIDLDGDRELSSEDEENYYDSDGKELDHSDVDRYGTGYAKYKARVLKQLGNSTIDVYDSGDNEEDSDDDGHYTDDDEPENFDLYD